MGVQSKNKITRRITEKENNNQINSKLIEFDRNQKDQRKLLEGDVLCSKFPNPLKEY